MSINQKNARRWLEAFDFKKLFVEELGWGRAPGRAQTVPVAEATYRLQPLAQLGGMLALLCEAETLPPAAVRRQIETRALALAHEHILIFTDAAHTQAVWLWVKRAEGQSAKAREHTYHQGQPGDSLLQKLRGIAFDLEELNDDGDAASTAVTTRVKQAFDVERITKRFYDRFKDEHTAFLKFIRGVDDAAERAWYASVMLNRLMFIYFIQHKDFLDDDANYLPHKLAESKQAGRDQFYRRFLTTLFFEGFAQEEADRSPETRRLLGRIPYLNGGLFLPHAIEITHGIPPSPPAPLPKGEGGIQIPDAVFERLFAFFDEYQWHLDDRPLRADNEINPDVLGYIFEKYINQKQMGAYYTKEDITGYIGRNTILPFLFDKLGTLRYDAVHPLPLADVEPYIYPAVKQKDYLPTETEREYAARMKRLAALRALLPSPASSGTVGDRAGGEGLSINDLITHNLDIERFAQDFLRGLTDPLTLRAFYFECLTKLTVLDPTVGSGAFLFAAMNILEPLYEICLDKMAELGGPKFPDFKTELARVAVHANRRYFIFKSIIVNNLYGVDLMEEATEICKLRLFLKLVAQIADAAHIEPLPDIDFNIRAGNTLVGYTSLEQIEQSSLFGAGLSGQIREADAALRAFRDLQTKLGISARELSKAKASTKALLAKIENQLHETLRQEYGAKKLDTFVKSHRPFHWYVEFNQIMQDGGFDVIVGNPPYVETRAVKEYGFLGFKTLDTKNLYAIVLERCAQIGKETDRQGFIVPISSVSTDGYASLQSILKTRLLYYSCYDDRPSHLFDGLDKNTLAILLISQPSDHIKCYSTRLQKWNANERPFLFESLLYARPPQKGFEYSMAKVSDPCEVSLLEKIWGDSLLANFIRPMSKHEVYYSRKINNFIQVLDFTPRVLDGDGKERPPSEFKTLFLDSKVQSKAVMCALNSTLFRWFLDVYTDGSHLNRREVEGFPFDVGKACDAIDENKWLELGKRLSDSLKHTSETRVMKYAHDQLTVQCIMPKHSKPIIDEIDRVLARHYGFTAEELDFILHYDIKYRMGKGGDEG